MVLVGPGLRPVSIKNALSMSVLGLRSSHAVDQSSGDEAATQWIGSDSVKETSCLSTKHLHLTGEEYFLKFR